MRTRFSISTGCLVWALISLEPVSAAPRADKEKVKDTTVRFLCLGETPPKYKRAPDGGYITLPYEFGEVAPGSVYLKTSAGFEQKPFAFSGISEAHVITSKQAASEGYFINAESPKTERIKDAEGSHFETKETADPKRVKIAGVPALDGGEHLICLFQPKPRAKWYPPKVLDIDTSAAALPEGKLAILNLSESQVLIQTGSGTRPFTVKSGGYFSPETPSTTTTPLRIKIVAVAGNRQRLVYNQSIALAKDRRTILAISSAESAEDLVLVNLYQFSPPKQAEPESAR